MARLAPRSLPTGEYPVLFAAEVARSLIGHLLGAVSGGALYRARQLPARQRGQAAVPGLVRHRGAARSCAAACAPAAFDAEGVATRESPLVSDGVLQRYVLGSYSARKLGLQTTANAGGVHNLKVAANAGGFEELVRGMGRGLLVTELMGQGVNPVTGDYSRGAAGFWVENGAIAYPGGRHHHRRQPEGRVRRHRGGRHRRGPAFAHRCGSILVGQDDGRRWGLKARGSPSGRVATRLPWLRRRAVRGAAG